ncbi:MAG: hypothetical protein JWQ23_4085 [Herminiimonas sp.]|nr:hypothetical protein [Herminiimonas sp.]
MGSDDGCQKNNFCSESYRHGLQWRIYFLEGYLIIPNRITACEPKALLYDYGDVTPCSLTVQR